MRSLSRQPPNPTHTTPPSHSYPPGDHSGYARWPLLLSRAAFLLPPSILLLQQCLKLLVQEHVLLLEGQESVSFSHPRKNSVIEPALCHQQPHKTRSLSTCHGPLLLHFCAGEFPPALSLTPLKCTILERS